MTPQERLDAIREAFDKLLIAEVNMYGGIPMHALLLEQADFREALAKILQDDE